MTEKDYKDTLHLPKTKFPMKANLTQKEREILKEWEEKKIYEELLEKRKDAPVFALHDGPPYANGHIHMGHALNKILKDIIIKYKSMLGYKTKYIPGWDCHGLPIELKVDQELGPRKKQMSKIEIRNRCKKYAEKYVKIQREEFKRLGVLGLWDQPYLTMNPSYEATIVREFGKIVEAGNVYRQKKPIYWCPHCQTALAEAEIEYYDHKSPSIYVKFPLIDDPSRIDEKLRGEKVNIVIWTTTPWTLPANLAVSLHPDERYSFYKADDGEVYVVATPLLEQFQKVLAREGEVIYETEGKNLEGLKLKHPIFDDKESIIILGEHVTMDAGTGCVHTAPGHGEEDYDVGLRYGLEVFAPVDGEGKFTSEVPQYQGLKVWEANPVIIEDLKKKGILIAAGEIEHSYPHCWRCKNPIIFRATDQWFISMEKNDLRKKALKEIDRVKWIPAWGHDRIYNMVESRPDWCISRQRSWGVPIIALYCKNCGQPFTSREITEHVANIFEKEGSNAWFSKPVNELIPEGTTCPHCGGKEFDIEHDIVDVWFESGVSYAAVCEKDPDLGFPVDLYLEGSDQHRGWFHSSLLTSVITRNRAPYNEVLTHGFVVDGQGRKMSKSLGNVISPEEIIKKHGAEILRLWVAAEDYRDDIRISQEILKRLVDAYRRIRNTVRFMLGNLYDFDPEKDAVEYEDLLPIDRYMLHRTNQLIKRIRDAYDSYNFHIVYHTIHNFCVVDLSSFYLDILKDRLYTWASRSRGRRSAQTVIYHITKTMLKLIAPIISFTSYEAWKYLPGSNETNIFAEDFPTEIEKYYDEDLAAQWETLIKLREDINRVLELKRQEKIIGHSLDAKVLIIPDENTKDVLKEYEDDLPFIFIVSQVELVDSIEGETYSGENFPQVKIGVTKAEGEKCQRCWNYSTSVGKDPEHPDLCEKCIRALKEEENG